MNIGRTIGRFAVEHPRLIATVIVGLTFLLTLLAALPSIWPHTFSHLNPLVIDTDPENMLPEDETVRVFHDRMKEIMSLNDMIVVGVVNDQDARHGVFNPTSLQRIYALTEFARGLRWRNADAPLEYEGVVAADMIAPSLVDNVESAGAGVVRFEWLMSRPPKTQDEALDIRRKALNVPFLKGTMVSEDGQAIALYLPITNKKATYRIYSALQQRIENPSRLFPSEIGHHDEVFGQLATVSGRDDDSLMRRVWELFSRQTRQQLLTADDQGEEWQRILSRYESTEQNGQNSTELKERARQLLQQRTTAIESMVKDLNNWMKKSADGTWFQADHPLSEALDAEGRQLLTEADGLDAQGKVRLKRLWIEAAFGNKVIKSREPILAGDEAYHITGLPVAEETFGVQMFKQMAISAPVAMVIIFLLMWFFFRSALMILPAIYDAILATLATMSLLVITGNTVHIMSSMIPIFIVPIAVLDDVHVISEFFDRYQETRDRKKTIENLMGGLFTPMLYTTLTTAIGFASLALAPIPPVQVFGLFVAFGVIVAWLCSILLVPAFISILPQKVLDDFGAKHGDDDSEKDNLTLLGRILRATGRNTYRHARLIIIVSMAALILAGYGISLIRVNDNPTKWFDEGHPIRIADKVLNEHFGGTYMAYLAFRPEQAPTVPPHGKTIDGTKEQTASTATQGPALPAGIDNVGNCNQGPVMPAGLESDTGTNSTAEPSLPTGLDNESDEAEPSASSGVTIGHQPPATEIFKNPQTLRWLGALQNYLNTELGELVGKSNSVTDIVETVHRELLVGVERDGHVITAAEAMRIPDTHGGVAQSLLQFQNSHRPQDLWHFVTPDYRTGVIWLQLQSGDNRDMSKVTEGVNDWLRFWGADVEAAVAMVRQSPDRFRPVLRSVAAYVRRSTDEVPAEITQAITDDPSEAAASLKQHMADFMPVEPLRHDWFGLTYINVVWQDKMVKGMMEAFLGSFLAVFLMMTLLYRSALWGILCMAPLTVTIAMTYGLIGLIGKDYDMPVAVLSALSLGLAVDYAIHFLTRSRMMYSDFGSWAKTAGPVFGEPARAIARNAIVVGIGFLPLLLAPLVPYQTVGIFIAAILLLAGVTTMLILPAAMTLLENKLFPRSRRTCTLCHRTTCIVVILTTVALIAVNARQFVSVDWTTLSWISLVVIAVLGTACLWSSRNERSKTERFADEEEAGK
ncbi:MAG: MMPL family transporter [Desulfuromonadales bacterium]|nr:MMPL family transporter [Desulfuromonadales bacterium]